MGRAAKGELREGGSGGGDFQCAGMFWSDAQVLRERDEGMRGQRRFRRRFEREAGFVSG
jgi:hypothetical protein